MSKRYPPHKCILEGCNVITTNSRYCCKDHVFIGLMREASPAPKVCAKCKIKKPGEQFIYRDKVGNRKGRKWCRDCCDGLSKEAHERRSNTLKLKNKQRREANEQQAKEIASKNARPVYVDAKTHQPEILAGDLLLGHPAWPVSGLSIQACPFAA